MTEILFYHLTESTLDQALPPLLEKTLARGWRAGVQLGSNENLERLDSQLWTWRDESFLAHGKAGSEFDPEQPILLVTDQSNGNGATVRFLVDQAEPGDLSAYERAVFMFDGHDQDQLAGARAQWKIQKSAGHAVTYWQQSPEGRWEKKA